ncbi:uncharacterized protein DDB_G0284459 isoform X2 [Condylostylus longicornis]|uniref:uncharacterized protein DDB_G0284459 isoform X2 n=1 Tax=Condylostylus longicornis TaxID=2530218 RepID=UPI00244E5727|nr:uncharacterized protein DDB_G0284459 isoform X2 [Condylostylus longicornis]
MKRSGSTNTLEETLDISSDKERTERTHSESSPIFHKNLLKKSFSEDTVTHIIEEEIPLTPPAKIKSRSRLSSAFRSLRGTKSSRKKAPVDPTEGGLITSGEDIEIDPKNDDKEKTKKKTKLSKKFSLTIKKYRGAPKKSSSSSENKEQQEQQQLLKSSLTTSETLSSSQTSTTLQHHPLSDLGSSTNRKYENNDNLNLSQVSLIDLPSDNETDNNIENNNDYYDNDEDYEANVKDNQDKKKFEFKKENNKNLQQKQNIISRDGVNFVITDKTGKNSNKNNNSEIKYSSKELKESENPLKFEKVRKIQITIQGKKIERVDKNRDKLPTTTTSISGEEDYLTATEVEQTTKETSSLSPSLSSERKLILAEQSHSSLPVVTSTTSTNKRQSRRKAKSLSKSSSPKEQTKSSEKQEKLVITQSLRDTPPSERAPPKPTPPEGNSPNLNKGAIKKTPVQEQKIKKPINDSSADWQMQQRDKSSERGRRYPRGPRPTDDELLQIEKTPKQILQYPKTGNNIQNPNLSGSIGVIEAKEIIFDIENYPPLPPTPPTPPKQQHQFSDGGNNNHLIEFSVGKIVRSQPVSQLNISDSQQPDSILLPSVSPSPSRSRRFDKNKRNRNETDYYSDEEERELIESINRESYLSGISEYSLDSELIAAQQQQQNQQEQQQQQEYLVPIMTSSGDKREHLYKILIIGELGTGKTSFIKRYVHKFFSQNYRATIGVDFALKVLHWDQNTIIRLQLWDIAGQERFGNMTRVYYKDAVGAFIVFDVTRSGTFECVSKWKEDLDSKVQLPDGSPIPCILLANKCDQEKQGLVTNPEKMDEYVKENGFAGWFETSAKENINIDEAARALVNKILLNDKLISAADLDADKIDLQGSSGYGGSGGKKRDCAC